MLLLFANFSIFQSSSKKLFSPSFHWFIYENNTINDSAMIKMENLSISVDADIFYVNFGKFSKNHE